MSKTYDIPTPWIVLFEGEYFGPFDSEDECYSFAAKVSREPNDWTPIRLTDPSSHDPA